MTFILNLIVGAALSYQESALVRCIVNLAISTCLVLFGWYLHHNAVESAYKRGWEAAYAKVAQDEQTQSAKLSDVLQTIFDNHTQTIVKSLHEDKEQRDEIAKLLQTGVYVNGHCHEHDAISLLNDQIRKRNNTLQVPATPTN